MRHLIFTLAIFNIAHLPLESFAQGVTAEQLLLEARDETEASAAESDGKTETNGAARPADTAAAVPDRPVAPKKPASPPGPASPAGSAPILVFGALLIAVGSWGFIRFRNGKSPAQFRALRHVQSLKLSPKHQLSLVDIDGRRLVIGLTDGAITMLTETGASSDAHLDENDLLDPDSGGWTDVFQSARRRIETEEDFFKTDGELEQNVARAPGNRARVTGLEAYDMAAAKGSRPRRAVETDSVVVALEKLERRGGGR